MDFEVIDHGSIVIFEPVSDTARDYADDAFAAAQMWGNGYVVEKRYAPEILYDLVTEQLFVCSLNGNEIRMMEEAA